MARRIGLGGVRVSRARERVLAIADFPCGRSFFAAGEIQGKDCFGATPKVRAGPALARETRALPRRGFRASTLFLHHENKRADQRGGEQEPDALQRPNIIGHQDFTDTLNS